MKKFLMLVALVGGLSLVAATSTAEAGNGYGGGYGFSGGYGANVGYRSMPYRSGNFQARSWNNNYQLNYGVRQSYLYPSYPSCHTGYCGPTLYNQSYVPSCGGYGW